MSGVAAAMTRRGDSDAAIQRGPAEVHGPSGWFEAAAANWRLNDDDTPERQAANRIDGYNDLADALEKMGRRYRRTGGGDIDGPTQQLVWNDFAAARQAEPKAFGDIPAKTQEEFDTWAAARQGGRAKDMQIAANGGFGSALVPGLVQGIAGIFDFGSHPENAGMMGVGGTGKTLIGTLGRQYMAGVLTTAIVTPQTVRARAAMGEGYSSGQMLEDANMAGLANVGFVGAHALAGAALGPLIERYRAKVPEQLRTPDEIDALHTAEQVHETEASSPYTDTHDGLTEHARRLQEAIDAVQGRPAAMAADSAPAVAAPAPMTGGVADYTAQVSRAESGGNANARNSRSSASGLYQFTDGTWVSTYRRAFPGSADSRAAILARKGDVALQQRLFARLTADNAATLRAGGHADTPDNLYLAHFAGSGGALKVLDAAPGAMVRDVLGADVVHANPFLAKMTVSDLRAWAGRKMGGAAPRTEAIAGLDAEAAPMMVSPDLDAERPALRRDVFPDDDAHALAQSIHDGSFEVRPVRGAVKATVDQATASDDGLGPSALLGFQPKTGTPGISVINDEGHIASAVYRDERGVAQAIVQMPISDEGRAISAEVLSYVRPEFRRQGIASQLYDALAVAGHDVDAVSGTGDLTPDGAAFVNARRTSPVSRLTEAQMAKLDAVLPPDPTRGYLVRTKGGHAFVNSIANARREALRLANESGEYGRVYDRVMKWNGGDAFSHRGVEIMRGSPEALQRLLPDEMRSQGLEPGLLIQSPDIAAKFDEPAGDGVQQSADSAWHDIDAAKPADGGGAKFDLEDGRGARTVDDIYAELQADAGALETIRGCL